jgi:hypothetical protein
MMEVITPKSQGIQREQHLPNLFFAVNVSIHLGEPWTLVIII